VGAECVVGDHAVAGDTGEANRKQAAGGRVAIDVEVANVTSPADEAAGAAMVMALLLPLVRTSKGETVPVVARGSRNVPCVAVN